MPPPSRMVVVIATTRSVGQRCSSQPVAAAVVALPAGSFGGSPEAAASGPRAMASAKMDRPATDDGLFGIEAPPRGLVYRFGQARAKRWQRSRTAATACRT